MAKNEMSPSLLASIRTSPRPGDGVRPMQVRLDAIDPDPDQPRKNIDEVSLQAMAETMKKVGVLQPIEVRRSAEPGKWIIVLGERRWRAARLAGLTTVPAYEGRARDAEERTPAQVIENQHRSPLTNTEIARAVEVLTAQKISTKEIGIICGVHEQQVKLYRAILKLPEGLMPWADRLDLRTVYELYLAWQKADEAGKSAIQERLTTIGDTGSLSLTEARRFIRLTQSVPSVRTQAQGPPANTAEPETRSHEPAPVREAAGHIEARTTAAREGEGVSLRRIIHQLVEALESAAEALSGTQPGMAAALRSKAQAARKEAKW